MLSVGWHYSFFHNSFGERDYSFKELNEKQYLVAAYIHSQTNTKNKFWRPRENNNRWNPQTIFCRQLVLFFGGRKKRISRGRQKPFFDFSKIHFFATTINVFWILAVIFSCSSPSSFLAPTEIFFRWPPIIFICLPQQNIFRGWLETFSALRQQLFLRDFLAADKNVRNEPFTTQLVLTCYNPDASNI